MSAAEQPLKAEVEGDRLVISIGIDVLAFAATAWEKQNAYERSEGDEDAPPSFTITDKAEWASDVLGAICREREDGSGPLTDLLDAMFQSAIEEGAQGVEYREDAELHAIGRDVEGSR